jgi:hypothetical protein
MVKPHEGLGTNLDNPIPNCDFPVLHSFYNVLLVKDIVSDCIRKARVENPENAKPLIITLEDFGIIRYHEKIT